MISSVMSVMFSNNLKRYIIALVLLASSKSIVNSRYLSEDAEKISSMAHFIDDNGIKVETQNIQAIVVDSGYENRSLGDAHIWDEEYDDNSAEDNKINLNETHSNAASEDDDDKDPRGDGDRQDEMGNNIFGFNSPGNILDIIMALHSALQTVEEHRQQWSKNSTVNQDRILEDDRLKRNSNLRKNDTGSAYDPESIFQLPLTPATPIIPQLVNQATPASVSEARYIKGDPLKGYYDFVITEGSYKFWAGFQLVTAALVIYSTFAAIYYSKVSPIVGDYDYVDYLGGGRALSDAYVNYQDPSDDSVSNMDMQKIERKVPKNMSLWSSFGGWIPQLTQTTRTIFDTIDRLST